MQLGLEEVAEKFAPSQNQPPLAVTESSAADPKKSYWKNYRETHKEAVRAAERRYKQSHRQEISDRRKTPEFRERNNAYLKAYRARNKERDREKLRLKNRLYHHAHKKLRYEQKRRSMARHPDRVLKAQREYRERTRLARRAYINKYLPAWREQQRRENPLYLLRDRMRSTLRRGLFSQGLQKVDRAEAMVGCFIEELKAHIEVQFVDGMKWSDPSSFSIDHFVPISAFDLLDTEERLWAFNWRNLRPLPLTENLQKHASIPSPLPSWLPAHIVQRINSRRK
jgi:hypothetical protein